MGIYWIHPPPEALCKGPGRRNLRYPQISLSHTCTYQSRKRRKDKKKKSKGEAMRGRMGDGAERCGFGWGTTRLTPLVQQGTVPIPPGQSQHMQPVSTTYTVNGDTVRTDPPVIRACGNKKDRTFVPCCPTHGEIKASNRDTTDGI